MDLRRILERLRRGEIDIDEAERIIRLWGIEEIENIVKYDIGRHLRRDVPEIIYGEGKSEEVVLRTVRRVLEHVDRVLISRVEEGHIAKLLSLKRDGYEVKVNKVARIVVVRRKDAERKHIPCKVGLVTGGTADVKVAEEVRTILEENGCEVITLYDVGIAGLHRAIEAVRRLKKEDVDLVIVIAGMEGALPSIIATLIDVPVIGVPTSVGYGAGGKGQAALLSMLQSCPLGVAVVNIDGGVAAAIFALLVCNRLARRLSRVSKKKT
ncbi:MAG: nickel pincer cofactor biosynthesis protein LarB [Thermoprotei archaeon]|nr:MAG: nickel pincer cofactor biosynthesis protein LarB [Thermoprotei archaeon]